MARETHTHHNLAATTPTHSRAFALTHPLTQSLMHARTHPRHGTPRRHLNSPQLTSTHLNSPQRTSTHHNSPELTSSHPSTPTSTHLNSPQLTSTHLNSLQLTSTHLNSPQLTSTHLNRHQRGLPGVQRDWNEYPEAGPSKYRPDAIDTHLKPEPSCLELNGIL
jgi:hypothetical protein